MQKLQQNKPDFFIVGAPKCGTTFLQKYLQQHKKIFLAQKELYFFGKDLSFKNGSMQLNYYLNCFANAKKNQVKGDNSVWYLFSKNAAKEIYNFNPNAKIIICLRKPTNLIYSLHSQQVYNGNENETDFETALNLQHSRREGKNIPKNIGCPIEALQYYKVGLLYQQVKRYFDVFKKEQICIVLFKEIKQKPNEVLQGIFNFLNVENFKFDNFENVNSNKKSKYQWLTNMLKFRPNWFVKVVKFLIPNKNWRIKLQQKLWKSNTKFEARKPIELHLKKKLDDYFYNDLKKLEALIAKKIE